MRIRLQLVAALVVTLTVLASGCGDSDDADEATTTTTEPAAGESQAEPDTEPEETAPPATEPSEDEADQPGEVDDEAVTFSGLSAGQQRVIGGICEAVHSSTTSPQGAFSWGDTWVLSVLSGEAGVPALEAAYAEIGQVPDPGAYIDVSGPICDEIGWVPPD